ncbi:MAG: hypothetical protein WCO94_11665 [Verrucomicrobiota bacterium]
MKTYLNTETGLLTLAAGSATGIQKIACKRGDLFSLEVVPSGTITGASGVLAAKTTYSGEPVALASSWTAPETEGAGYVFSLNLNTTELNALFTGETPEVTLLTEITWTLSGVVRSTQTFSLVVARDVWVGDEPTPSAVEAAASFLLSSPDGSQWTIAITNDGQLERTKL